MSLQGTPFLVLLAVLALGLPVVTVRCWHRVRGRRGLRVAQRGALLGASQLGAVLVVVVALNNYGEFYSSWTDLFHGQPHTVSVSSVGPADAPTPPPGRVVAVGATPHPSSPAGWARAGRLEPVEVVGASSHLRQRVDVWFPPQYFQPRYARSRFPAVEVFAAAVPGGAPNPPTALYAATLRRLIEAGTAAPVVLVMLHGPADTTTPECVDTATGPQADTFVSMDVPSQLAATYRLTAVGWGALGTGAGGYCAVKAAMTHARVFRAAVSVNGCYTAPADPLTAADRTRLWGDSAVLARTDDLQWRLDHLPAPPVTVLVVASAGDASRYRQAERFASSVRDPMKVSFVRPPARSAGSLADQLTWLAANLRPAQPTAETR